MRTTFRLFVFFVLTVFCALIYPHTTLASPHIFFHVQQVNLHEPGEAEIVGYFENDGNEDAYAKWVEFDLTLDADNDQWSWENQDIRHYTDVYVPAQDTVDYAFLIQDPDIPEYHGEVRWKTKNSQTHWSRAAG